MAYHLPMGKKSDLTRLLEESIKRVKRGELGRKPSSLSDRLRKMDDMDLPDSLEDPRKHKKKGKKR